MANFAQLDENNTVIRVIVVDNNDVIDPNTGQEDEEQGRVFCRRMFGSNTRWVQTSRNHNIRVRYAGVGYTYNEELDAFVPPKPFPSWILKEETASWEPPVGPEPERTEEHMQNSMKWRWDEEGLEWKLTSPQIN
jgi:hypothetical protein